ncbi:MAG TPA: hypothetical protein PLP42_10590 [Acidobacteriota bacterium]|nr:hypothetical protein [Acidobacteriota bacterium]
MKIESGLMVALGYGKYFRSDRIAGLEPVEEGRGPRNRTLVYIENRPEPIVASRSESAILRDMVQMPKAATKAREVYELLTDILDTISEFDPILKSIIREQGGWDLDMLKDRISSILIEDQEKRDGRREDSREVAVKQP